jgi:hypothetical protein
MTRHQLVAHVLGRLHAVQQALGVPPADADCRFADALDSMALVEFLGALAGDCAVAPEDIERAAGRRFSTPADLADQMLAAGLFPRAASPQPALPAPPAPSPAAYLAATALRLPAAAQPAEETDALLGRPAGWFRSHTGIAARRLWADQDALAAAADAADDCLGRAGVPRAAVAVLLATGEAPPLALGLAAALHARIGLPPGCVALEVGGACVGLVAALWLARGLLGRGPVLVVAAEAPSRWQTTRPGPQGELAALFGDGAGACLLTPTQRRAPPGCATWPWAATAPPAACCKACPEPAASCWR